MRRCAALPNAPASPPAGQPARLTLASNDGLLQVFQQGSALPAECFDRATNRCSISRICKLRNALAEATRAFESVLDRYTLADIAANGPAIVQVLGRSAVRHAADR